ncbi:MAG TPA: SIS domain-containing protein [Vicinamibacterales bacterium]|nr:SIS domain-containing protein [Vicinamibacterales bacterium]
MQFAIDYLEDLKKTLDGLDPAGIGTAVSWLREARDNGRFIYVCGNGGSASIASQMVVDLVKGASYGRDKRFKVIPLTDSVATITAYANDVEYECVFVEPLRNFARDGDVLLAISGSGNSPNVLRAVEYANSVGCRTIGLTRSAGGALKDLAQLTLGVPNTHMGRLEDSFFILTHVLMYAFMDKAVE